MDVMQIVFFSHPASLGSQSMPRFTNMLASGMEERGHKTEIWRPVPRFYKLPCPAGMKKWLAYIDQYILFPAWIRRKIKRCEQDVLFVFIDHALGPWVPVVSHLPHVIHCHDFLAQRSANGEIRENPTGKTGVIYQSFIRRGFQSAKNFISVSDRTREDLHRFLIQEPTLSEVVYNGLNPLFKINEESPAREIIGKEIERNLDNGYWLHVGGNQWYKNRIGVIEIYDSWRKEYGGKLPLLMIGPPANAQLIERYAMSSFKEDIYMLSGRSDDFIRSAYNGAAVFLFPSLAEGFGWPIAEAMASGCPVITTNEAPMTEVGGTAAFYIPRRPFKIDEQVVWALDAAGVAEQILTLSNTEKNKRILSGLENVRKFDQRMALDRIEKIYKKVIASSL